MANKKISEALSDLIQSKDDKRLLQLKLNGNTKYIIFSDLHRGLGDAADDFKEKNQLSYSAALIDYYKKDYTLILLGDVEELEEQQNVKKVMNFQNKMIQLELNFHKQGRLIKIFGNHDDKWKKKENVDRYLEPIFGPITVYEGILFERSGGDRILVTHGHQGSLFSDRIPFADKLLIPYRFVLNLFNISRKTLFNDLCSVGQYEQDLYDWSLTQDKLIFICGHTHRPIWAAKTHAEILKEKIEVLKQALQTIADSKGVSLNEIVSNPAKYQVVREVNDLSSNIKEYNKRVKQNGVCGLSEKFKPTYFNTGCCIYTDGNITGIEIDKKSIQLIKWSFDASSPVKMVLETEDIDKFVKLI